MRFHLIIILLLLIGLYSCDNSDKKHDKAEKQADTTTKVLTQYLKTDYPDRVLTFRKMPDATIEEQVVKYERFAVLFIEYVDIYKRQPLYSPEDQENNTEAYNILRDELASLKAKIRKNISLISKYQEARLDTADARMNKFLPSVYK